MSLKLSGLFCTPAVVHTSCFDYVLKATAWKMKTAYMFAMLVIWCKMQRKKLLQITVSLRKWIQLKVYSHPVKNVSTSSLTFVLIFGWIELVIWRSHRKICQNFIFDYLGRKICIVPDLNRFLPHWTTCFMPILGDFIQWRILYAIRP